MELLILALLRISNYALVAVGFALVFGTCRVLNLMHGSFVMLGAYSDYAWTRFAAGAGLEVGASWVGGLGILVAGSVAAVLGWAFFRALQATGRTAPTEVLAITVAGNLFVSRVVQKLFGTEGLNVPPVLQGRVEWLGVTVPRNDLLTPPVAILAVALLALWLSRARSGVALRAVADDPEAAALQGIPSGRMLALAVGAAAFMAGAAGAIGAPSQPLLPDMWVRPLLISFAVVVFGGGGSIWGALAGASVVGGAETLTSWYVDEAAAQYVALLVIVVGLVLMPTGLAGGPRYDAR